jgi:DNA polymerase-3 subunit beta
MIGKVLFAVSSEESRFQLSGALLKLKGKRAEMIATDGHRLALIDVALPRAASGEEAVLVPRKALHELLRLEGEGSLELRRGEHHLAFRAGEREMICRILEGSFPDYERVIARNHDKKVICERRTLGGVQRVALVATAQPWGQLDSPRTRSPWPPTGPGRASETLACEYTGPGLKIGSTGLSRAVLRRSRPRRSCSSSRTRTASASASRCAPKARTAPTSATCA